MPQGPTAIALANQNQANILPPSPGFLWKGYRQITSLGSATPIPLITGARLAVIKGKANMRYLYNAAPTSDNGQILWATEPLVIVGNLTSYQFIAMTGATGSEMNITYWG